MTRTFFMFYSKIVLGSYEVSSSFCNAVIPQNRHRNRTTSIKFIAYLNFDCIVKSDGYLLTAFVRNHDNVVKSDIGRSYEISCIDRRQ